jgi:2-hydroxychromene-2-carboxylate isomerase
MLSYGGDWYWGIDRLGFLEERLRREGLEGSLGLERGAIPALALMIEPADGDPPTIEAFVSFRSPYSYLAIPQLIALRDRYGVSVRVRPVLPMVMRGLPVPLAKRLYIARDAKREADRLGIPFGRVCDPLGEGIGRCMAVFYRCAVEQGLELEFCHSVMRGAWSEARDLAHLPDFIDLAERAGIGEANVRASIDDRSWQDAAKSNRQALTDLGLWGVPSLRIGAYSTWGQDRIPLIESEIARFSDGA